MMCFYGPRGQATGIRENGSNRDTFIMLKIALSLLIFLQTMSTYALSAHNLPMSFSIKQITCTAGKHCVELTANGKKIGSLQPSDNTSSLLYFFDEQDQKQVSIKQLNTNIHSDRCSMKECLIFRDFGIYEKNHLVAKLELSHDVMLSSFDGIRLYTKDRKYLLISGTHTRVSGTTSIIYDGLDSSRELVRITRPWFTYSLDSEITILDRSSLLFTLDPNIFAAALAVYCNTSLFYDKTESRKIITPEALQQLRKKLQDLVESQGLLVDLHTHMSTQDIKMAGANLSERYQQIYGDFWDNDSLYSIEEKLQQLIDLGADVIVSHALSPKEEKALLQFLISQLYINQPE